MGHVQEFGVEPFGGGNRLHWPVQGVLRVRESDPVPFVRDSVLTQRIRFFATNGLRHCKSLRIVIPRFIR